MASQKGHLEMVKFLIENGADVRKENKDGVTPLSIASQNGNMEVIEFLLAMKDTPA